MQGAKMRRGGWPALLAFFVPALGLLCVFALVGIWPFGPGTVLTGDLGGIYMPIMSSLRGALTGQGSLLYSFSKSLGGEMLSGYAAYADVLFLPLLLLVPAQYAADALLVNYLVKIGLTGLSCYLFLANRPVWQNGQAQGRRLWPLLLSWCYALCSYAMAFLQNPMWLNTLLLAPLVLACLERLAKRPWRFAYCISLAACLFANFYTGYMLCLFCALYFAAAQFAGWQRGQGRQLARGCGVFALYSALAGGLAAVVIVVAVTATGSAKGGLFSGLALTLQRNFSLLDLPQLMVSGNFSQGYLAGWLPFVYCGYLALLGAVLYLCSRAVPLRAKLAAGGILLVLGLSFMFQLPNLVWHGFSAPVWFSFRYSFLFILLLVIMANDGLARLDSVPVWGFAVAGAPVLGCILFALVRNRLGIVPVAASLLLCAATLALLLFMWRQRQPQHRRAGLARGAAVLLALCVFGELFFNACATQSAFEWRDRGELAAHTEGTALLKEQMQPGYRAETQWFYTLNDPLQFGFMGFSFFNSVQDDETLGILQALGFVEAGSTLFGSGSGGNPAAGRLLALRYRMGTADTDAPAANFRQVFSRDGWIVYEDDAALPLAFAADSGVAEIAFTADVVQNQNGLWQALTGVQQPLLAGVQGFETSLVNLAWDGESSYSVQSPTEPSSIDLRFTMPQSGTLCVSLSLLDGIPVYPQINGEPLGSYNGGLLSCGWFAAGEEVTLSLGIGANEIRLADFRLYIESEEAWQQGANALQGGRPGSLTVQDGHVELTVHAAAGQVLYTSIPYAQGWRATVNGRKTETLAADGLLLLVPLQEGENTVVLAFTPPGLRLGGAISLAAALALLLLWALSFAKRRIAKARRK